MGVRVYPDQERIYVDQDGPLGDLMGSCRELGIPPEEAKLRRGFYESMRVTAGAKEGIAALFEAGHQLFVLSKPPSRNPYAATEKIIWLHREFPQFEDQIILSPDKGAVGKPRDHLIDDNPHWANANNFPGRVLHFGADGMGWPEVVRYFEKVRLMNEWLRGEKSGAA